MHRHTKYVAPALLFVVLASIVSFHSIVQAYSTGARWSIANTTYSIDPNLDTYLGIPGTAAAIRSAASTWDDRTIFRFIELGYNGIGNTISAANFNTTPLPGCASQANYIAVSCIFANGSDISYIAQYFNTSGAFQFNTSNINSGSQRDVQSVATHEFGHWISLWHSLAIPSVMEQYTVSRVIEEDDKQGVSQLWGAYTGFDSGRASGISNLSSYFARVSGYSGSTSPLLGVVGSGDFGVPSSYGTQMLRLSGNSNSNLSYIYFKLFSFDKDESSIKLGAKIPSNSYLKWCQYNYSIPK